MVKDAYLAKIEWEVIGEGIDFTQFDELEKLPAGAQKISVWRDSNYKLTGKLFGNVSEATFIVNSADRDNSGALLNPFPITGSNQYENTKYEIAHCLVSAIQQINQEITDQVQFEAELWTDRVKKITEIDLKPVCLKEWYLNGSSYPFLFKRFTERKVHEEHNRKRGEIEEKFIAYNSGLKSRDYILVPLKDFEVIIQGVPKSVGPNWSNNIAIEYRYKQGNIPNDDDRRGISEIVSFLMGKQLLYVGYTIFTEGGYPIEEFACNPWGTNVIHKCKKQDMCPVNIDNSNEIGVLENILKVLVPQYLILRKKLNLAQALQYYWAASDSPIGANLPILHAGLEAISKSWFKTKSKSKGVYIPKKQYDHLLKDDLASITQKLQSIPNGNKVLNKIRNAYSFGVNEKINSFFSEIGLKLGDVEKAALQARNPMAHGDIESGKPVDEKVMETRGYETLFHRILLKILGYDGKYIDYSSIGWPELHIDEPMKGTIKSS